MKIVDKIWNFTLQETITRRRRTINRPLLHYLLLLYHNIFLLSSILYDFFGIIFIFFSASIARSTDVPLRVSTAPSLRAALWFSRLRRLQSCFKQKRDSLFERVNIFSWHKGFWLSYLLPKNVILRLRELLSLCPITPHIRDVLFSLLLCHGLARLRLCFIIFGSFLCRFW